MATAPPPHDLPGVSRVAVFGNVAQASRDWAALEAESPASAYQTRGFAVPWLEHMSVVDGARPMIVVAYDAADRPLLLAPFVVRRRGPLRVALYAGAKHSNLNMPLVRPGFDLDAAAARRLLAAGARAAPERPNLFVLLNQPRVWNGAPNPFARLSGRASPSDAFGATFGDSVDAFLARADSKAARKKLKSKAAKLAELGPVRCERAGTPERARTILAAFVEQKTARFSQKNKDAGVSGVAARAFFDSLATATTPPALDLYALLAGERIVATYAGLPRGRHWHGLFNSFANAPDIARASPGDLLLRALLRDLGARGFSGFDLGVGEARYKSAICDERIELVDVVAPVDAAGAVWAGLERARLDLKRRIKHTPWALAFAERMRAGPF